MDSLESQLVSATDAFFREFPKQEAGASAPVARDFYEEALSDRKKEEGRSYPNGAKAKLIIDVNEAIKPLVTAFNIAKHNYDRMKERGDVARARMFADQYMHDTFFPTIEAIVRINSVDELLNAPAALEKLDEVVLLDGGSSKGYTRSYVKTLYGEEAGQALVMNDAVVEDCFNEIVGLLMRGQVRTAVGKATKLMKNIDEGRNVADDDTYVILQKVVARGQ